MKNIIITGASQGIGYQTVVELSKICNANIIVISRNFEKLHQLKIEVELHSKSLVHIIEADLETNLIITLKKILDKLESFENQHIDILINNAGILLNKEFAECSSDDWKKVFNLNIFIPAQLIRLLLPYFSKISHSHIVNIGSMGGVQGTEKFPGLSVYSASKSALITLTESLAIELKDFSISVNAINPGTVDTEMLQKAFPGLKASVSSQEMGRFIADFALNNAKLMNGRIIQVSLRN